MPLPPTLPLHPAPAHANPARAARTAYAAGLAAESLACAALQRDGFEILRRRARTPAGEIDIVAARPGLTVFAEVKQRATLAAAVGAVGGRQARRLLAAAEALLGENPDWAAGDVRFDVIAIDRQGTVRRVKDACRLG